MNHQHLPSPTPPTCVIPAIHMDPENLDPKIEERATVLFLKAVSGVVENIAEAPQPVKPVVEPQTRANRLISDAARSADEAARLVHRQRVVAPLLMLLALGLLLAAAGWSC